MRCLFVGLTVLIKTSPLVHCNKSLILCSAGLSFLYSFCCALQHRHFLSHFLHDTLNLKKWYPHLDICFQYSWGWGISPEFTDDYGAQLPRKFPLEMDLVLEVYFFLFLFYCWPIWASVLLGCVGFLALVTKLRGTYQKFCFLSLWKGLPSFSIMMGKEYLLDSNSGIWSVCYKMFLSFCCLVKVLLSFSAWWQVYSIHTKDIAYFK